VSVDGLQIDDVLASALRGDTVAWPNRWAASESVAPVLERIRYHGVAGLLADADAGLAGWPSQLIQQIREQAVAQAMWELRHRALLTELLAGLADAGIVAVLLKGTAVAYDLYASPATRARGDTDLLIAAADLDRSRSVLERLGYLPDRPDDEARDDQEPQEIWILICDSGAQHQIDLHWHLLNATALKHVLPFSECAASSVELPRLCEQARTMDRVHTLIHTCLHRAMHFTAPYFTNGIAYYGGDRLIWANDVSLLAGALSNAEWTQFCALARQKGISAVCLDGLMMAKRFLATEIPDWVREDLGSAPSDAKASRYLLHSRQGTRVWHDLMAIPGLRPKFAYLRARSLPSPAFIRDKYPDMAEIPLVLLYARRVLDLLRTPPAQGKS
jgi:hypothetical protein